MNFNLAAKSWPILGVSLSLVCGCAGREIREMPPYPASPKSASELRQIINELAREARPLKLKGRLTYWAGPDAKPGSCRALIMAEPPRKLRVKGYRSLGPTLFEAASDGKELLLYTYSTGEITRPGDEGEEAFYQRLLEGAAESLYPRRIPEDEILLVECTPKYYIISLAGKGQSGYVLRKRLWISSDSLTIAGSAHYDEKGIPLMKATMSDYTKDDEDLPSLPSRITLYWPGDGAVLEIVFKSIEKAGEIPPGAFTLSGLKGGK